VRLQGQGNGLSFVKNASVCVRLVWKREGGDPIGGQVAAELGAEAYTQLLGLVRIVGSSLAVLAVYPAGMYSRRMKGEEYHGTENA
jgi:hypothetical protein